MSDQDMDPSVMGGVGLIQLSLRNLGGVVAETGHLGVNVAEIIACQFLAVDKCYIGAPGKAQYGGAVSNPVMISCDNNDPDAGDGGEEVIDLLQILLQRLSVKQISCNEQEIGPHFSRLFDNRRKGVPDIAGTLPAPGFVAVRGHAPVYIAGMNEFHVIPLSFQVLCM